MSGTRQRNTITDYFGQPDATEGSVNEPRLREENGFRFNEKWVYRRPAHDPANAVERTIYWQRYDFVGSVIRTAPGAAWQVDDGLLAAVTKA
jgi:hypothetical protein